MAVVVKPTLEAMAHISSLSSLGGDRSPRFEAYVEACRSGELLHGFNPMTTKPVASVIESMLEFDAERVVLEAGREAMEILGADDDVALFVSVAAPGLWTDRSVNAIEHQLAPRHIGEVLLWFDEELTVGTVRAAAIEQTVRAVWWSRFESKQPTLSAAARREGLARVAADRPGTHSERADEALGILGADRTHGTAVAFLFGDDAAEVCGYSPMDLSADEGLGHAVAVMRAECSDSTIREVAKRSVPHW